MVYEWFRRPTRRLATVVFSGGNEKSPLPGGGGSGLDFRKWRGRRCTPFSAGIASGRSRWPAMEIYSLPSDFCNRGSCIAAVQICRAVAISRRSN
ncbi:hypothetical protein EN943_20150 [Mesorhizobium sp. M7A.F.Ca.US.006.01.1.1]|nr:hypothetical protein EN943_20150 [Mesorhizobium sp. M7A.F.Ca.US.006.01.1.1]